MHRNRFPLLKYTTFVLLLKLLSFVFGSSSNIQVLLLKNFQPQSPRIFKLLLNFIIFINLFNMYFNIFLIFVNIFI